MDGADAAAAAVTQGHLALLLRRWRLRLRLRRRAERRREQPGVRGSHRRVRSD
jgi:hypothetical protein